MLGAVQMLTLPILFPEYSVNQRLPSGPTAICCGALAAVGIVNSLITPAGVIRPTLFPLCSKNQRFPSGPAVIPSGWVPAVGIGNSVIAPAGVTLPILFPPCS